MFAGFLFAAASAIFNGSFAVCSKFGKAKGCDPIVFNLWLCVGVFLSSMFSASFFSISGNEFGITIAGMIGGVLLVLACLFSFLAIPLVGLAVGQGVWGATAILVAFLWGAIGPDEIRGPLENTPLSIVSLLLLTVGICGILYAERVSSARQDTEEEEEEEKPLTSEGQENHDIQKPPRSRAQFIRGLVFALLVGIFGGSILVPLSYVGDEEKYGGIGFLPSFGVGSLIGALFVTAAWAVRNRVALKRGDLAFFSPAPMGILSGLVWNLGNVCSILAMGPIGGLSYGIAYPLMQCALLISGLWGILVFKEIKGTKAISIFFVAATVLLGGAAVLGVFGPQKVKETSNQTATENVFSEPAIFERLSHFKDYGVPGTVDDPLNQAMIADASCRLFDNYDGFTFYHNQTAVTEVIAALASLPPTGEPSHFTLTARNVIPPACGSSTSTAPTVRQCNTLPLTSLTGSMDNWHRALCAPNGDPSWGSTYDPAYQPQQVALTVGFMCIVACDCAETNLPAEALAEFASSEANAKQANVALCQSAPYGIVNFTAQATTPALLTEVSAPIREVCGCAALSLSQLPTGAEFNASVY